MKKIVKGGPITQLAGKALDALFRGIDDALADLQKKKEEQIEEDGIKGKYFEFKTSNGNLLQVKLFPAPTNSTKYIIRLAHDGGKNVYESDRLIHEDKLLDKMTEYCDKYNLGSVEDQSEGREMTNQETNSGMGEESLQDLDEEDASSGTKISVTLQRVSAGSEDTINLCAISASNAVKAMSILDDVLADDTFVATITEEPVSFEITETADEYDVENTDTVDTSRTFEEMLKACVECYHNLECIHWAAKGKKFHEIHSYTESLMWDVRYNIDTIAEWCVEFTKKAPNVLAYQYTPLDPSEGYDFESAMSAAKYQLDNYIKVLECYYVNVDHDVQSVMDNWIRDLKKKSNYVLDRTLMPECDVKCVNPL